MPARWTCLIGALCAGLLSGAVCVAEPLPQPAPMPQMELPLAMDSGWAPAPERGRGPVLTLLVSDPQALWLRLFFGDVVLGEAPAGGQPTTLVMTSMLDGHSQTMRAEHIDEWQSSSAYFNGHAVLVQVEADAGAAPSRVVIDSAWLGVPGGGIVTSLCSADDQRVLTTDARTARTQPLGCTAFMIDDPGRNFLTAGHCGIAADLQVVQFNVPMSLPNGQYQHPGPEHQYAVDQVSVQRSSFNALGNDWTYFAVFPNTETGLRPHVAQGDWFDTMLPPPPATNQPVRVTGYGLTQLPVPNTWNGVLKTHDGPLTQVSGTTVRHRVDTTGGNSGSPVIDLPSGRVFAIHTHGGCTIGGASNGGMALTNISLQNAIAAPLGQAIAQSELAYAFPSGLPDHLDVAGTDIVVEIIVTPGYQLDASTPTLHVDLGSGVQTTPLSFIGGSFWMASIPPLACGESARFWLSAQASFGAEYRFPATAPMSVVQRFAAESFAIDFADDFETDLGWIVVNDPMLADGNWERGIPAGNGSFGDPVHDADGSGRAYLTGNRPGESGVLNGATTLISPVMDATAKDAVISYFRWFSNSAGENPYQDIFIVDVSENGGASWVNLEVVGPSGPEVDGGWYHRAFRVDEIAGITATDQFRIRFIAIDTAPPSVVEAAVDGVQLARISCPPQGVFGDLDGDGAVNLNDLLLLLGVWGPCVGCDADLNGDGVVDLGDLLLLLSAWS